MSYLNSVLGTLGGCPYAPREKCDPVSLGAAGIMAGASFLGNLLGFGSSSSANSTNIKIAEMNNRAQWDMMKAQQAYNEEMWNKQNEYNSPINQTQRLLAAGINPATVFGNGSISEAGQLTAPQLPTLQQAHVNPFTPDFSGVGQAVNAYFQNQLLSKNAESAGVDTALKRIDLMFKAQQTILNMREQLQRIDESLSRKNLNDQERENLVTQRHDLENRINFFEDNIELYSAREKKQNDLMDAQTENYLADSTLKRANSEFQQLVTAYYPEVTKANLAVASAQFSELMQSAQLKAKEGKLVSAQAIGQYLKNGVEKIQLGKERLKDKARNANKATRTFYGSLDMLGEVIFSNIRLFK